MEVLPIAAFPEWIKNNAKWWSEDQVDDRTFVNGIGFLIKENIVDIDDLSEQTSYPVEKKSGLD